MRKPKFLPFVFLSGLLLYIFVIGSCKSGVETSPAPGIIRITLQSDPLDTAIVIVADTFYVTPGDSFGVTIFQGKVYSDSIYSILYPTIQNFQQKDITYNLIRQENGQYREYVIFESYVPPGEYYRIQFGLKATVLRINNFDEIKIESPPNTNPLKDLYRNFKISENKITEVKVILKPFQSVKRYRDTFQFYPVLEIKDIQYQ